MSRHRPVAKRGRIEMKLVIRVEEIEGSCPCYKGGEKIVLDDGFRLNPAETDGLCMHSMGPVLPWYVALAKGIPASQMGLARKDSDDGKAYVHCPDPCRITGGGTVLLSIERVDS